MIDTRFTAENPVKLQWTRDISPIRCYQSGITLNGNPVTIDADRPELSTDITESPLLEAYKIINEGKIFIIHQTFSVEMTDGIRSACLPKYEKQKQLRVSR